MKLPKQCFKFANLELRNRQTECDPAPSHMNSIFITYFLLVPIRFEIMMISLLSIKIELSEVQNDGRRSILYPQKYFSGFLKR